MDPLNRIAIAGRVFCLAAIVGLAGLAREPNTFQGVVLLAMLGATAIYVSLVTPLSPALIVSAEALSAGLVIGLGLPETVILLPYMVVLPLIAALSRGVVGLSAAVSAETLSIVLLPSVLVGLEAAPQRAEVLAPWLLTGLGAGLLGVWLRQRGLTPRSTVVDASYEAAHRLLTQLRTVTRRLSAGLDPVGMSSQLLTVVHDQLQDTQSAVFVRAEGDVFSPLSYRGTGAREALIPDHPVIDECWSRMEPAHTITSSGRADRRRWTVLPLRVGSRMVGVVISASADPPPAATVAELMRKLDEHSMRIDTALTFEEVRTLATADERRRLAREIHDGIAQEVASLGYVVDELVADSPNPAHVRALQGLRGELTRVVSELRLSIFDLRSEIIPQAGLGAALSDYVRQVGSRSKMTVHLTLDEAATRLTGGVEAELFRIAQEAITNARKHSEARNLWVDCWVRPPFAWIKVSDDGCGLPRASGDDSFGMRIMQERASRIDARLSIHPRQNGGAPPGTVVTVTLGEDSSLELVQEAR